LDVGKTYRDDNQSWRWTVGVSTFNFAHLGYQCTRFFAFRLTVMGFFLFSSSQCSWGRLARSTTNKTGTSSFLFFKSLKDFFLCCLC
jgi:hypothetical protein